MIASSTTHADAREGNSILWLFDLYWQRRICKLSWFKEAQEAGYFGPRAALYTIGILVLVSIVILWAGDFIAFRPPARRGAN